MIGKTHFKVEQYETYCDQVANSSNWGGQVELEALANALEVPIDVFSATEKVLRMGSQFDEPSLCLSYVNCYLIFDCDQLSL